MPARNIPAHLPIDVAALEIGDALRVSQIPGIEGVEIVDDPEKVLVHVVHPRTRPSPSPRPSRLPK